MNKRLIKTFDEDDNFNNAIVPLTIAIDEVVFVYHHEVSEHQKDGCLKVIKKYEDIKVSFDLIDEEDVSALISKDDVVDISAAKYLSCVLFEEAIKKGSEIIYYDDIDQTIKSYRKHCSIVNDLFKLNINDIVALGGGKIINYLHKPIEDRDTINLIYDVIDNNCDNFNEFINYVTRINSLISDFEHEDTVYHLDEKTINRIKTDEQYYKNKEHNLFILDKNDLIFYSHDIRNIFMVSGTLLENYIYHKLLDSKLFDDVRMSSTIEFSFEQKKYPITCELDCLVLKNNSLLFVSIKSNKVETDDLNEIRIHNYMFGNHLSKAVICTNADLNNKRPAIYAKAEELDVCVIDKATFKYKNLAEEFLKIIEGTYHYDKI